MQGYVFVHRYYKVISVSRCIVESASELPLDSADTDTSSEVDSAGVNIFAIVRPLRRTNCRGWRGCGEPSALSSARRKKWVRLTRGRNGPTGSTYQLRPVIPVQSATTTENPTES